MCKNLSYKILFILSLILTNTLGKAQFISVDTNYNAQQLVDKFLGANNACIRVSNVSITGWNTPGELSYGYFTKNGSNFSIDEGIILSTGKAADAHGPKGDIQSFTKDSWHGDSLLEQALNMQNTFNATILEFDFTPSLSDRISFEYMFLSEQYLTNPVNTPKLNQCNYTDAFVFLIKEKNDPATSYKNIAVLPNTNIPVAVNTVRGQTDNNACPVANPQYFGQYNSRNPTISPTNFNGETKVLTASTIVDAGKIYTIRLAIADQNNGLYDSAVFLKAGSFVGNQNLGSDLTMDYKTALCPGEIHKIDATPISGNPISFIWKKNGQILPIGSVTSGGTTITNLTSQINIKAPNQFDEYTPENEDLYEVEIELDSGCRLKGDVKVEKQISPDIHQSLKFEAPCDDDLDGNIDVFFSAYVQRIISNISASDQSFDIKYFKDKPADPNNPDFSQAITSISFSTDSQSVWIWVKPGNCDPFLKEITFSKKAKSIPNTYSDIPICDNELTGSK
ncbi:choice-of-anchor L domain-containing protein [Soonwooa sp.]|uniref:choice-of-anchor L domain-containing protein n=1 Tax=Soonwooa sp. TaxID=1938592 RepID=UPI00262B8913|nr:choice-of-anchor L domain-containing protein [Soonwooa sp.]